MQHLVNHVPKYTVDLATKIHSRSYSYSLLLRLHGIVEVSSTSNQSAYRVILGLGHRSGCTKNNTVSLVDFFSTPFGVDRRLCRLKLAA